MSNMTSGGSSSSTALPAVGPDANVLAGAAMASSTGSTGSGQVDVVPNTPSPT